MRRRYRAWAASIFCWRAGSSGNRCRLHLPLFHTRAFYIYRVYLKSEENCCIFVLLANIILLSVCGYLKETIQKRTFFYFRFIFTEETTPPLRSDFLGRAFRRKVEFSVARSSSAVLSDLRLRGVGMIGRVG